MGLLFLLSGFFTQFVFPNTFELARENPLLRDHFLQQQLRWMSMPDAAYAREYYPGNAAFLEERVDWMIDDFLTELSSKLGRLKTHFKEVQRARTQLLALASDEPEKKRKARLNWKKSLKKVADRAEDLRDMLSYILLDLHRKSNFQARVEADPSNVGFRREIEFIEDQILKTEKRIREYFFLSTHRIHVHDLQGENMLIYLYRVRKMSKRLSQELESESLAG